jgi:hypothetical protein
MFNQTGAIQDYVFPLCKATKDINTKQYAYKELIGTGFLIGNNGYALTAAHVIDQLLEDKKSDEDVIVGLFQSDSEWNVFEILQHEKHPTEDVGIIRIQGENWKSFLTVTDLPQNSACEYHCWGYPHEIAKELRKLDENALDRPELVYTQGYIRRRISRELYPTLIYRGVQFYEVSETIGGGASGGPIIKKIVISIGKPVWQVIGIYIGEREDRNIGYAVRAEAFANWVPTILKKRIIEEATNDA